MNYIDLFFCGFSIFLLVLIFIKKGRHYTIFHPINIILLTVGFEFITKYLWVILGSPLDPIGLPFTYSLLFIDIFLLTLYLCLFIPDSYIFDPQQKIKSFSLVISPRNAFFLICCGFALNGLFATVAGGSPLYGLQNPIEFRIFMQRNGMFYVEYIIFFCLISGLSITSQNAINNARLLSAGFIVSYALAVYVTLNSGLRGRVVEIAILPILVFVVMRNRVPKFTLAMLGLVFAPFVVAFGMYRDAVRGNSLTFSETIEFFMNAFNSSSVEFLPLFLHRFDAFDNFVRVMEKGPTSFHYMQSFFDFISQPIPRFLWENKPNNFTSEMTQQFRPDLFADGIALTFSAFAESYLNFGFIAGAIIFGIFMYLTMMALQSLMFSSNQKQTSLIIFCLLYQYPFIAISAGFINDVATVVVILAIIIIGLLSFVSRLRFR